MAHNQMVDHFRTQRFPVDLEGVDCAEPPEAEESVLAGERSEFLQGALQRLSADHREVLIQRFINEKSAAEIGQIMGRKEVTVRGLQWRALRALRREIDAMGADVR
jgi:RNA polymerase sigma-70 factor (ECF subfamily)